MKRRPSIREAKWIVAVLGAVFTFALVFSIFGELAVTDNRSNNAAWIRGGTLQVMHRSGAGGPWRHYPLRPAASARPVTFAIDLPQWRLDYVIPRIVAPGAAATPIQLWRVVIPLWIPITVCAALARGLWWLDSARARRRVNAGASPDQAGPRTATDRLAAGRAIRPAPSGR